MGTDTAVILEQLVEATNQARASGRTWYVFYQDKQWWFSGKLPKKCPKIFYIAYPSGAFDQSAAAAEMTAGDWNEYHWNNPHIKFLPPKRRRHEGQNKDIRWVLRVCAVYIGRAGMPFIPDDIVSKCLRIGL